MNEIRNEFQSINKDQALTKVILSNEQFLKQTPDGGGQLTGFYKNGELKKIVRWFGLSNGNEIFEFYFKNNKLIFVYEEFNSFFYNEKTQSLILDSTYKSFAGRYYFMNEKLVDQVTRGHNRFEDDAIDPENILLKEALELKRILLKKSANSRLMVALSLNGYGQASASKNLSDTSYTKWRHLVYR